MLSNVTKIGPGEIVTLYEHGESFKMQLISSSTITPEVTSLVESGYGQLSNVARNVTFRLLGN